MTDSILPDVPERTDGIGFRKRMLTDRSRAQRRLLLICCFTDNAALLFPGVYAIIYLLVFKC